MYGKLHVCCSSDEGGDGKNIYPYNATCCTHEFVNCKCVYSVITPGKGRCCTHTHQMAETQLTILHVENLVLLEGDRQTDCSGPTTHIMSVYTTP